MFFMHKYITKHGNAIVENREIVPLMLLTGIYMQYTCSNLQAHSLTQVKRKEKKRKTADIDKQMQNDIYTEYIIHHIKS